jgi:outer membrane usher protein
MRVRVLVAVCALGLGLLLGRTALAEQLQYVPLRVVFNAKEQGDRLVYLTEQNQVWFPLQDLRTFGFIAPVEPRTVEGVQYVLLDALAPNVTYTLDLSKLLLQITSGTEQLETRTYDFQRKRAEEVQVPDTNSAFLNYAVSRTSGDNQELQSVLAPYELAVSFGKPLLYSSFIYSRTKESESKKNQRLVSSLSWDEPDWLTRFTVGDVLAGSGDLGSQALVGGFGIASEAELDPFLVRFPGINISGAATTPSKVQVLINDLPVFSEDVAPGRFEFRNLPYALGAGVARVIITDAFGRESTVEVPYYNSQSLLKAGAHDFGYFSGYLRLNLKDPLETREYGDPAYYAFHRYGVLDWLNLGLRAEGSKQLVNVGASTRLLVGRLGEVAAAYATSRFDDLDGNLDGDSASLSYQYSARSYSFGIAGQRASREYATIEKTPADDKNRLSWSANAGLSINWLGSLSLAQLHDEPYIEPAHTSTTFTYLRQVASNAMVLLRATQDVLEVEPEPQSELTLSASLLMFFGNGRTASVSHSKTEDVRQSRISYQKSVGAAAGFNYGMQLTHDSNIEPDGGYGGDANLQYNGRWGQVGIDHRKLAGLNSTTLNLAGSIAWVDGGLYPSRPITDSFALVRVPGIKGVRVKGAYQDMGDTNADGELLISNLSAYNDNAIAIDQRDIPFEYEVGRLQMHVAPWHRGGAVAEFQVKKIQALVGRLFVVSNGERKSADLAGLEVELPDRTISVIIGNGGEFYLENIQPGRYKARIFRDELDCRFTLEIPASSETIVNLGEKTCEAN